MSERVEHSEAATPPPPEAAGGTAESCPPPAPSVKRRRRWLLLVGLLLPAVVLLGAFATDRLLHRGQVLRGVTLAGSSLAGLDRGAVDKIVVELEGRLDSSALLARVRRFEVELKPAELGFGLDRQATRNKVFNAGRQGAWHKQLWWWLARLRSPEQLQAVGKLDEAKLNASIDQWQPKAINDPPFEGAVVVEEGKPRAEPPRRGWVVDRAAARAALLEALVTVGRQPVALPLVQRAALRDATTTKRALQQAERLLSAAVVLLWQDPGAPVPLADPTAKAKARKRIKRGKPVAKKTAASQESPMLRFRFSSEALAGALRSGLVDKPAPALALYFDGEALEPALSAVRARVEAKPVDATFSITRRDKVSIVQSRKGRLLDAKEVATALLAAATSPQREGPLPVKTGAEPALSSERAKALNIKGLVSQFTTRHPCCRPRVKNIHRIADLIDGVLLEPGQTFGVNEHVGPRTARKGFAPAPTIVEGEMKDTIGGGISQFATTLFNAAFHGGYEIVERAPHSFYFRRYPVGHEATLSFPHPDLVIRNDTEAGLLIRCFYTNTSIMVKLYGDNGGRKVRRRVSRISKLVKPPLEYIADPDLDPEEEKVKEKGQSGWTVHVARIIKYPDGTTQKQGRKVVYKPRVRRVRVHPCKIPHGEDGYTGDPCPEPEDEEEGHGPGQEPTAGPKEAANGPPVDATEG